jgi:hypothetical protein
LSVPPKGLRRVKEDQSKSIVQASLRFIYKQFLSNRKWAFKAFHEDAIALEIETVLGTEIY